MPQLSENEIAFFRYRNRLLAGVCLSCARGKARFAAQGQGPMNIPTDNIVLATGDMADSPGGAAAAWARAKAASSDVDLAETWDLVHEESDTWALVELGELCFGDDASTDDLAALLLRLEAGDFFVAVDDGYQPLTESDRARQRELAEREAERQATRERFRRWMRNDAGAAVDEIVLQDWTDRLKDYVLHDAASAEARWVERTAGERLPLRRCFDRLVSCGVWDPHEHLDLLREGVPTVFSPEAIRAADRLVLDPHLDDPERQDLTDLPVFTVDDVETQDIDDGLSVVFDESGGARLGVHITDAASLIPVDGALFREAAQRVSSIYLPDARYPMLPERISGHLGSLVPGEPRLGLSLLFDVSPDGELGAAAITPSVVRSAQRLSYEDVDRILEDPNDRMHGVCARLRTVAERSLEQRLLSGAVAVEQPELKISIGEDGTVSVARRPRNSPASFIVSEMMVLANVALARYCAERRVPAVYRTQRAPDLADLQDVQSDALYRYQVLRRMQRANMSLEAGAHGGLGVDAYCQASSPLRRFGDLTVQRQIVASALGKPLPYDGPGIQDVIFQAEERTRQIARLERRRTRYWLLRHLETRVGESFGAVVLERYDRKLTAELEEFGIRVDAKPATRPDPGESVTLRLGRCDAWNDELSFTQAE